MTLSPSAASPPGFNRRRSERIAMPPGGPISVVGAQLVNVSLQGMLIESLVPLERDSQMSFRLVMAGEKVDVVARVACCSLLSSQARKVYGLGLEFTAMPAGASQRLAQVLAAASPAKTAPS